MSSVSNFHMFPRPSVGFYYIVGQEDARHGHVHRTLPAPDDIYQSAYDDGYAQGLWTSLMLDRDTM